MSRANDSTPEPKLGYRNPPRTARFVKGQSGTPRGRPRGSHRLAPYDAVLGQIVTIREGGIDRKVTAAEAFLLHLAKKGLEGDGAAACASLHTIETARHQRRDQDEGLTVIIRVGIDPGSVVPALEPLRLARKIDRYRPTAKVMLEPWIVSAALARLGDRKLSKDEQRTVVAATRTPHKVDWPSWWTERT